MERLNSTDRQSWLSWFLRGITILGFLIFFARLVDLQIIRGNYFKALAEENRIRRVPIIAPRGRILARGGETLVGNKQVKKKVEFKKGEGYIKSEDIKGASDEDIISEWERVYYLGEDLGHVSGYLGEVDEDELGKIDPVCPEMGAYSLGAFIGRSGLEEQYNCKLSGINGEELVEVDSAGEKIRTLGSKDPIDGNDLKTNIDYNLQIFVSDLLEGEKGAIIITDPKGEVLALYSSPSYNPNIFIKKDSEKIDNVFNDSDLPLFNRAIGGKFPPGSIFKPLVAIAALEEEKIDKDYMYEDTGQITFNTPYGDFSYRNWYYTQYGGVEGKIKLPKAIARSTDTFFYKVGELLGVDNLVDWSGKFGLNEKTGIDLPGEVEGLVPSPEWKEQVKGERWFLGNTYHMSIGQGDLAVTPIAMNTAIASIASGGNMCTPSIAKDVNCKSIDIEKENIDLVKEGMVLACSEGGTAYPFFNFDEEVACKTGTAQIGNSEETHAWFSVFSPVEDPEVVITILVEEGGEGSSKAAPIARKILDYWYDKPISTPVPTISSE